MQEDIQLGELQINIIHFFTQHIYILPFKNQILVLPSPFSQLVESRSKNHNTSRQLLNVEAFTASTKFWHLTRDLICRLPLIITMPSTTEFLLSGRDLANRTI